MLYSVIHFKSQFKAHIGQVSRRPYGQPVKQSDLMQQNKSQLRRAT